jgi:hypothetical protein
MNQREKHIPNSYDRLNPKYVSDIRKFLEDYKIPRPKPYSQMEKFMEWEIKLLGSYLRSDREIGLKEIREAFDDRIIKRVVDIYSREKKSPRLNRMADNLLEVYVNLDRIGDRKEIAKRVRKILN